MPRRPDTEEEALDAIFSPQKQLLIVERPDHASFHVPAFVSQQIAATPAEESARQARIRELVGLAREGNQDAMGLLHAIRGGLSEQAAEALRRGGPTALRRIRLPFLDLCGPEGDPGILPGTIVLLTGPPGVGKTTMCLQIAGGWKNSNPALRNSLSYVGTQEPIENLQATARRLGVADSVVFSESQDPVEWWNRPVVIDMLADSPSRVMGIARSVKARITEDETFAIVVVNMTRGGDARGPLALQHEADVIMSLWSNDGGQPILEVHKNRQGPTRTVYLRMTSQGLEQAT